MLLIYPKNKGIINLYNKIKSKGASIYAKCLFYLQELFFILAKARLF